VITEEKWQEMKVAEKREWLREQVEILQAPSEPPRVVDKTARMKIADLQKAIEHLSTRLDHLENVSIVELRAKTEHLDRVLFIMHGNLTSRIERLEEMLGVVVQ